MKFEGWKGTEVQAFTECVEGMVNGGNNGVSIKKEDACVVLCNSVFVSTSKDGFDSDETM